jgi:ribosomal protein S1
MTDSEKPDLPPPEGSPAPPASDTPGPAAADAPRAPAPLPPEEPRVAANAGPVRSLEHEQKYGGGRPPAEADADIERQLQEAMGGMSVDQLLADPAPRGRPPAGPAGKPGRLKGRVHSVRGKDVFVDVPGGRSQGVLPAEQFPEGPPAPGTEVEFSIEGAEEGLLKLTRKGAAQHADWSTVADGMIVEARVTGTNKGGLTVDVNGIRAFLPISQIELFRVEDTNVYVNQRLRCLVTEVNPQERNLVVSRRALLEKEREEERDKTWNELAEGQVRQGVVRSVKDFGAFVDVGGVDGLLHVSEMAWTRVRNPADVVQPGQSIKVVVLKVDREKRKVSLGLKQLSASPWDDVASRYPVGEVVTGKVSRIAEFGAFVELEPAIEGLVHVSELSPQRVWRVRDIVQEGQEVPVMVLSVDTAQRRIALSLKAAQARTAPPPQPAAESEPEDEPAPPPQRPRTTPLRGGLGERK